MVLGSSAWFYDKANTREKEEFRIGVEKTRKSFIEEFSPTKLKLMDDKQRKDKIQ